MREATKADLPKGAEAQCVICWRIFGGDSVCERHKPYAKPKSPICKEPATLGMVAVDRRGLAVWTRPTPQNQGDPDDAD